MDMEVIWKGHCSNVMMGRLTMEIIVGSSIAHYTGQTLYKKVLESNYFKEKDYEKAMTDAFLALDKSLIEGKKKVRRDKSKEVCCNKNCYR